MSDYWKECDQEIQEAQPHVSVLIVTDDMHNTPCWAIREGLETKGYQVDRVSVITRDQWPGRKSILPIDLDVLGMWP